MRLTLLSAADLRAALPMREAVAAMRAAFAELSSGRAAVPLRVALPVPPAEGLALFMPAYVPSSGLGAKIVSVFPRNPSLGKPIINGLVVVLDAATGEPLALCDGTFLTAWRTGAGSGAATDLLARPEARVGAVLGCGAQARTQAVAIDTVRALEVIRVYAPTRAHVEHFVVEVQPEVRARLAPAASAEAAVRGADVICVATTSAQPVLAGDWLAPGAHVNGVGSYTTQMQEVDAATVGRARIFVDARAAALAEAGDLVIPMRAGLTRPEDWTELGEVAAGQKPGRQAPGEITFFKSVGVAVQDVAAAGRALEAARRLRLGQEVEF
ncbi:MAG: ornithine cyclodeaminase [Anaerolineales bacterium]|nr:ornithine cyclodeaminase [Anaerolineales bacterium]